MYERAASASDSLWHIGNDLAFFAGPLGHNALHTHSVPVFLAGLYGAFRLRLEGGEWLSCRTAVVPAGVAYEFDLAGDPLGVIYLEPTLCGVDALIPLTRNTREIDRAVVGTAGDVTALRQLYEIGAGRGCVEETLQDLLRSANKRARKTIDARVALTVGRLQMEYENPDSVAALAKSAGLSPSRLQHLFAREVGVPLRRYRTWQRLRAAIREVANGSTYTNAAHSAGFYDQPHFAREFRRTFGASPSRGLSPRRAHSPEWPA